VRQAPGELDRGPPPEREWLKRRPDGRALNRTPRGREALPF
jgi:hypothetical protein